MKLYCFCICDHQSIDTAICFGTIVLKLPQNLTPPSFHIDSSFTIVVEMISETYLPFYLFVITVVIVVVYTLGTLVAIVFTIVLWRRETMVWVSLVRTRSLVDNKMTLRVPRREGLLEVKCGGNACSFVSYLLQARDNNSVC